MSVYPNPTTIIQINTTKTITASLPAYLRTFAICSSGDTLLQVGKSQFVSQSDYESIINPLVSDNYTRKWLVSFFKNCIGKMVLVVELGTENTTSIYPMLDTLNLTNKGLELNVGDSLNETLNNNYEYTFSYANNDTESQNIFTINANANQFSLHGLKAGKGTLQVIASGNEISTTKFLLDVFVKEPLSLTLDTSIFDFNVVGDPIVESDVSERAYNVNTTSEFNVKLTKENGDPITENAPILEQNGNSFTIKTETNTNTGTFKLLLTTSADNNHMKTIYTYNVIVKASGETLDNISQEPTIQTEITEIEKYENKSIEKVKNETTSYIDVLKNYIAEQQGTRAYKYSVSRKIMAHEEFASLVETYSQIDSSCYFSGETIKNVDPNTDSVFAKLKSKKGFFGVYNNCLNDDDVLDGGITGVMASSSYDISITNRMSPLCFKYISFDFNTITKSLSEILTDTPVTWIGYQAGQKVLFGGRYCDYDYWDYWYSWDNVRETIITNTTTFIINATNTQNSAVRYNQGGIRNIGMNIENTLNNCIELGYITRFGEYIDQANNELVNIGKIGIVDFETYINANADKYSKGIYDGYSCYIQIGRFVTQIIFNINLG